VDTTGKLKEQALEAYRILNGFVGDLVAGTRSLELFASPAFSSQMKASTLATIRRMCLSHLIITLSKWAELYDRYKAVIPKDVRDACRELRKQIETRRVEKFRNSIVGHIWDKELMRPLTSAEIDTRLSQVFGEREESFLKWINDPKSNVFPSTVVAICEHTRDRIQAQYGLQREEIFLPREEMPT